MNKKIVSGILVLTLTISLAVFASADTNIVDSMDFQGEAINLTLEEAMDKVFNDSVSGKTILWNEEKAEAAYWEFEEKSDAIDAGWNAISKGNQVGAFIEGSLNATRSDADILEFTGDFYRKQRIRNKAAEENTLRATVKETYFSIVNLEEMVKINEENVAMRQKLYDNTQTKFELGMVAKQDVLSAEYELMNAQTTYEESVVTLKNAKMNFNLLLGYDVMQEVVLTDSISDAVEITDITIAEAVSKALVERNEVYAAEFQLDLAEKTMESLQRKPVSDSEYKSQRVVLEEAKATYPAALDKVEIDVRHKYMDMLQKKSAVESSKKSVEAVEEALRLVQLSYDAGLAVLTDVQDVQTRVFQAKVGLANAILQYNLAVDAFEESMGAGRFSVPLS